jgi:hypothetical protein
VLSLVLTDISFCDAFNDFAFSCFGDTNVPLFVIFNGTKGRKFVCVTTLGDVLLLVGGLDIATDDEFDSGFLLALEPVVIDDKLDGIEHMDEVTVLRFNSRTFELPFTGFDVKLFPMFVKLFPIFVVSLILISSLLSLPLIADDIDCC